jgi:hypothetical protein
MSDLSNDECRGCGQWVNCWGDAAFYATRLCEDCRRKPKHRRYVTRKMREFTQAPARTPHRTPASPRGAQ